MSGSATDVPADSSAPSGTPEMVTESVSEPSASKSSAEILSGMSVSSLPSVSPMTWNTGASAMAATSTLMVPVVEAVCPSEVVDVAVTVRSKSSSELGAGRNRMSPPSSNRPSGIV